MVRSYLPAVNARLPAEVLTSPDICPRHSQDEMGNACFDFFLQILQLTAVSLDSLNILALFRIILLRVTPKVFFIFLFEGSLPQKNACTGFPFSRE